MRDIMKTSNKKFAVDSFIFILFILLAATGLFLYFKLPSGSHGAVVWGMSRHTWGSIHFWIAMGFLGFVALHLILNWNWIICMIKGRYKNTNKQQLNVTLALVTVLLLLLISILPFLSPVNDAGGERKGNYPGRGHQAVETNR